MSFPAAVKPSISPVAKLLLELVAPALLLSWTVEVAFAAMLDVQDKVLPLGLGDLADRQPRPNRYRTDRKGPDDGGGVLGWPDAVKVVPVGS